MGHGNTGRPPQQRGRRLVRPMRALLTPPHGRHHKPPPQPCALTTTASGTWAPLRPFRTKPLTLLRPDALLVDHLTRKKVTAIEFTFPDDANLGRKVREKREKYEL